MKIIVKSGIGADGFDVEISCGVKKSYAYGYNASWTKDCTDERKPYVADIIKDLKQKFNVDEIEVVGGKNVFANNLVSEKDVENFKNKYIVDLIS